MKLAAHVVVWILSAGVIAHSAASPPRLAPSDAPSPAAAAEAQLRQAYQDLDRIRAESARVRQEMEPYQQWQRAQDEVNAAARDYEVAREAAREAQQRLERFDPPASAPAAERAAATRARQEAERARLRQNDAISRRNQTSNDLFADEQGRRPSVDEIERRQRELDDQLEQLEQEERDAARRADQAGEQIFRQSRGGRTDLPGPPAAAALQQFLLDLARGVSKGTTALLDVERAIDAGDCRRERLDEARAEIHEAIGTLAGVADAAVFDAVLGDSDPTLQGLGAEAREALNELAGYLKLLEDVWAERCGGAPACFDPQPTDTAASTPPSSGPSPQPGVAPADQGPQPAGAPPGPAQGDGTPGPAPGGGGGRPRTAGGGGGGTPGPTPGGSGGAPSPGPAPGQTPRAFVGGTSQPPLAQDLAGQFSAGACGAIAPRQQQQWLDAIGQRALQQFGQNQLWFTRVDRDQRVLLFTLHRARLYDLAGQIALWNQLVPGTGDVPEGHLVDAARQGTLPQFVDDHLNLQATPGSLQVVGQPDTAEFREARTQLDRSLTQQANDHRTQVEAADKARQELEHWTAVRVTVMDPTTASGREIAQAYEQAVANHQQASAALTDSTRALARNPLLRREVGGRPLADTLADPEVGPEGRQQAIDQAVRDHLADLAREFVRLRDQDSFEGVATEVLHPALAPLQAYVLAVLDRFCVKHASSLLEGLQRAYQLHARDIELAEQRQDLMFLGTATGLLVVTLVGILAAPQFAIPAVLAVAGGADAVVATGEFAVRQDRAAAAASVLEASERRAALGALVDPAAVEVDRQRAAAAEMQRALAALGVAVSFAGGAFDIVDAGAVAFRGLGNLDEVAPAVAAGAGVADNAFGVRTGTTIAGDAPAPATPVLPGGPRGPPVETTSADATPPTLPPTENFRRAPTEPATARTEPTVGTPPTEDFRAAPTEPVTARTEPRSVARPADDTPTAPPPEAARGASPPGGAAAGGSGTVVLRSDPRPWSGAEAGAMADMLSSPPTIGAKEAALKLRGAQLSAQHAGGVAVFQFTQPIKTGGFGSVHRADLVPPSGAVAGLGSPRPLPITLDASMAPLYPLPAGGGPVAVKLFAPGEDGLAALVAELTGARVFEDAGVPYARYHAVGTTPDGTPFAVKELVAQQPGHTLSAAQQQAVVEGRAALARAGAVALDAKPQNTYFIEAVGPDGALTTRWAQYEGDFVGSVTSPSERLAGPLEARFLAPSRPEFALGGGAREVRSLEALPRDVREGLVDDAWVNGLVEAERWGEITFDPVTRTFGSGSTDIVSWRQHPEFGPALADYETLIRQRGRQAVEASGGTAVESSLSPGPARRSVPGAPAGARPPGEAAVSGLRIGADPSGGSRISSAKGTDPRLELSDATRNRLQVLRDRLPRFVARLGLQMGAGAGPYTIMTSAAPQCWTSIGAPIVLPQGAGGGVLVPFQTDRPIVGSALSADRRIEFVEPDAVKRAEAPQAPDDPFYASRGGWGQAYDDQWALKRIGFAPLDVRESAWKAVEGARRPIIVAVVDSGLDYFHPDLHPESVWRNPRETPNERDDDGNGYVDDLIGWNFVDGTNNPWDDVGHGTHVAGIIAAATGNGRGIAGVNPRVRIMPLKVLDASGRGRATGLAEAVFYAVRHGAHIINLSLGDHGITRTERLAIEYARRSGVVVVSAAGNAATDTAAYGPAGLSSVIAVAALDPDDRRPAFSNHGDAVKIAAPGVDVLSLRAARTDLNLAIGVQGYSAGSAVVGTEGQYYRASGTSFAAPFVSGVASLLLATRPGLTPEQVERMLVMSADDVDVPGWDRFTGAGRLNVVRALAADPSWWLEARITEVRLVDVSGTPLVQVLGRAAGSRFERYTLELGRGEAPQAWKTIGASSTIAVDHGVVGTIPVSEITSTGQWAIRVVVRDAAGHEREARGTLTVQ